MERSFAKNGKECENVRSFAKERENVPFFFLNQIEIYIDIYRYIYRKKNGMFFKNNGTFFLRFFARFANFLYDL